jgi:methyl-accepting chemotaxis protein
MDKQAGRRLVRVINGSFQYRLIAIHLTVVLAGFLAFSVGLTAYYWLSYARGDNLFREIITLHKQVTEVKTVEEKGVTRTVRFTTTRDVPGVNRLEIILPPLLINDLVIMVFVVVVGIVTSLRIAGPVFRVENDIGRALSGEQGVRVKVRRNDSFPDLAEKVNELLERLEKPAG